MNIKIEISVRRVAKGKLKKARFYADFRVSQSPIYQHKERRNGCNTMQNQKKRVLQWQKKQS